MNKFDQTLFPIISNLFPAMIADDLINVQPLPGPTSVIFYLDTAHKISMVRFREFCSRTLKNLCSICSTPFEEATRNQFQKDGLCFCSEPCKQMYVLMKA